MSKTVRRGLPAAAVLTGGGYIAAAPSEPLGLWLLFKAIPMALIIAYAVVRRPSGRAIHVLIPLGLGVSLIGDVTIHRFVVGLSAFLVAHLCYLAGFLTRVERTRARVAAVVPLAFAGGFVGATVLEAVRANGDAELLLPVASYVVVILAMAWAAILTGNRYAAAGSLLFVASDAVLAWDAFVGPVPASGTLIMTTYYGAQLLIARSVADFE